MPRILNGRKTENKSKWILSPARLPIPPHRQKHIKIISHKKRKVNRFEEKSLRYAKKFLFFKKILYTI